MDEKVLAALIDLRVALGELRAFCIELDQAIRKLMALELEALESKSGQGSRENPGDKIGKKEGSIPSESVEPHA